MLRTILAACLLLTLNLGFAQDREPDVRDTPEMLERAEARTDLVARTVEDLTTSQRERVRMAYLGIERQLTAIEQRFQGQPEADREADMPHIYQTLDRMAEEDLAEILEPAQLEKWRASAPTPIK